MSDEETKPKRRRAASRPSGPPAGTEKSAPAKTAKKQAAPVATPVFQAPPVVAAAPAKAPRKKADEAQAPTAKAKDASKTKKVAPAKKSAAKKAAPAKAADAPSAETKPRKKAATKKAAEEPREVKDESAESESAARRRRRRGGRGRNRNRPGAAVETTETVADEEPETPAEGEGVSKRSRKRNRSADEESGSTRVDAKRARRREGRDAGRRRAPVLSEAEFLARREDVNRVMVVRQQGARTQIAVLEDGILVEHYINQANSGSLVGNVYVGRVQNVLPGMEAAFVDIGKGRNAVLYAGEVNWDAAGMEGQPKRIEMALKTGDTVLVQVTKDPVGQKGARLTSQISLPGRFVVYVPNNNMTGISRKLPERERARLKSVLRAVLPEEAGVIVRTAAEGASEEELQRDVARLSAQWQDIETKAKTTNAPAMLYGEPDISIKVVRDIFNEDVKRLVVSGDDAWDTVESYVSYVAPDLVNRLERYAGTEDVFQEFRVDEQLAKALDRKVYLPSGGSLVIDRTEAMTVIDVNTGKFIGEGGNLEQTVTMNNLEAAEEIVRQLRLRDTGGIIVIDFIDMVLESNRDLVIRRLIECLSRDRTKHQVAEVTSLGLVQMTRKRIGAGLLEVFSEPCDHCNGRGVLIHTDRPVEPKRAKKAKK